MLSWPWPPAGQRGEFTARRNPAEIGIGWTAWNERVIVLCGTTARFDRSIPPSSRRLQRLHRATNLKARHRPGQLRPHHRPRAGAHGRGSLDRGRDFFLLHLGGHHQQPRPTERKDPHDVPLNAILLVDDVPATRTGARCLDQRQPGQQVVAWHGRRGADYLYARGQFADRATAARCRAAGPEEPRWTASDVLRQMKSDPQLKMIPVWCSLSRAKTRTCPLPTGATPTCQTVQFQEFVENGEAGGRLLGRGQRAGAWTAWCGRGTYPMLLRGSCDE